MLSLVQTALLSNIHAVRYKTLRTKDRHFYKLWSFFQGLNHKLWFNGCSVLSSRFSPKAQPHPLLYHLVKKKKTHLTFSLLPESKKEHGFEILLEL